MKLKPSDPGVIANLGDRYVIDKPRFEAIQKELPAETKASYARRGGDAFLNDYLDRLDQGSVALEKGSAPRSACKAAVAA